MLQEKKVCLMLADHAQTAEGKLYVIGGGWAVCGPAPMPFAIAGTIEFPWSDVGTTHRFRLDLIDSEGRPVEVDTDQGPQPVRIEGAFPVSASPETKRGTPVTLPLAINFPPTPIPAGGRFEWRLELDGETSEDWRVGFSTREDVGLAEAA